METWGGVGDGVGDGGVFFFRKEVSLYFFPYFETDSELGIHCKR